LDLFTTIVARHALKLIQLIELLVRDFRDISKGLSGGERNERRHTTVPTIGVTTEGASHPIDVGGMTSNGTADPFTQLFGVIGAVRKKILLPRIVGHRIG
jgi:hypothetical protein